MTTPLNEGQNPDDLGDRPAVDLGDYPEFFAYGGARGAEPGPAKAQPGSYQGYEDYFRPRAEPEPPVRSRTGGEDAGEAGEAAGDVAAGESARDETAQFGRPGQPAQFGQPGRPGRDDDGGEPTRISRAVGADGMPLVDVLPDQPAVDDAPVRSRRGKAASEPPARSRGRQVPAPRGGRDNAFKPADNAFGPADNAFGPADNAFGPADNAFGPAGHAAGSSGSGFGPAAWEATAGGRAAESPSRPAPSAEQPFTSQASAAMPPVPPHPDTRIPSAGQPDFFQAQAAPTSGPSTPPDVHPPFAPEPAPDYDYRDVAPAPDYDYRAPVTSAPRDAFEAEPPRSRRAAAPSSVPRRAAAPSSAPQRAPRRAPGSATDPATGPGAEAPTAPATSADTDSRPATLRQGPGRRRAKRSVASYLWPFRALSARPLTSTRIRSRSTAATVWRRLKSDRLALAGGVTIVVLILLAVFANVIDAILGVDPTTLHPALTDPILGPHGTFGGMSLDHPLGVDPSLGRDVLARLLSGARVSLLVAFASTVLAVGVGTVLGMVSGYVGGRVDAVISRLADLFLAFPLFLFALGLTGALSDKAFGLSGNGLRIAVMIFVMGFFNWPYIARIVRADVLSLREREFIDAARALGARRRWIIGRELMPNLLSPILVYATLLIPTNIIFEAGLSALGIGLNPPAASWGQMMLDASRTVYTDPAYLIVPGMAVFITVLAFNLFGDGLRDALDPTAQ